MSRAPSTATSPTKSSSQWNQSPRFDKAKGTTKAAKSPSLFLSTSPKKNPSASFFKNYSMTPNANRPHYHKDIAILHESRIFKTLVTAVQKKQEQNQRRDPILQNNNEKNIEFKPSVRRLASADRMGSNMDENFRRSKKTGHFNHVYNPQPTSEEPSGIKTFRALPSQSSDEEYTRIRKAARCTSSENTRNPITEGDEKSAVFKRWRGAVEKQDHHQKLNDQKFLTAGERGCSPRGKVFRDMSLTLGDYDYGTESKFESNVNAQSGRPLSSHETKMRGFIKETLHYESGPSFKADAVSDKVTQASFKEQVQHEEHIKHFGRKITLRNC